MYELTVTTEFCAAHAITMASKPEPIHGHNFRVWLTVSGDRLDADGLLCDFHAIEEALARTIEPLHNADLNSTPPFDRLNPTAEHIAKHIAQSVERELGQRLAAGVWLSACTVSEAPHCKATYKPTPPILDSP